MQFYVHRRLNSDYSVLCKYVVETLLCTAALFTCLSRVTDNMHHASDVVCGAAIGVIVAVWNVRTSSSFTVVIVYMLTDLNDNELEY